MSTLDSRMVMGVSRRRQPALHYELEQISKIDILRKLKEALRPKDHSRRSFPRWLRAGQS